MKKILPFLFIVSFCSCSTYQYITVSSPDVKQNDRRQFVAENDTMKLVYNFAGSNGPLQLTVFNKTDKPLLIDLNRSALIMNDKAISFYSGKIELSGSINGTSVGWGGGVRSSTGYVNAEGSLQQGVVFIPAGAYVTETPLILTDRNLENIPDSQFHRVKYMADDLTEYGLKTADFTREQSPMVFKTYLTFFQQDIGKNEIVQEHHFYVSHVCQSPSSVPGLMSDVNGDRFYVSKVKEGTVVAGTVVVGAALLTAAALTPKK